MNAPAGPTLRSGAASATLRNRLALLLVLLAAYGAFFSRHFLSGGPARLDPVGPEARQIERAIAERRYDDAKQLADGVNLRFGSPHDPLLDYWFALIAHGRQQPREEAEAWERFTGSSADSGGVR